MAKQPAKKEAPVATTTKTKPAPEAKPVPAAENLPAVRDEEPKGGALAVPDDMADQLMADAGAGTDIAVEERAIPFIRTVQSLSPQRQKSKPEFIEGADEGMIYNSVTKELWDGETDGIEVCVLSFARNYTEWWPRDSKKGKGLVRSYGTDASCTNGLERNDRGNWPTPNGTEIISTADYVVMVIDRVAKTFGPALLSMGGSQNKKARGWNTRLTTLRVEVQGKLVQPPLWWGLWRLNTQPESNDQGSWHGWVITPTGTLNELGDFGRQVYTEAKVFATALSKGEVKVAVDEEAAGQTSGPVHRNRDEPAHDPATGEVY